MTYHGPGSPGGAAHAFKVLERALPLLDPEGRCERREIVVETAFGGPGARDAFELVTRAVTGDRFRVDPGLARTERGRAWRTSSSGSLPRTGATLAVREGFVTDEFIDLARTEPRTPDEERRLGRTQARDGRSRDGPTSFRGLRRQPLGAQRQLPGALAEAQLDQKGAGGGPHHGLPVRALPLPWPRSRDDDSSRRTPHASRVPTWAHAPTLEPCAVRWSVVARASCTLREPGESWLRPALEALAEAVPAAATWPGSGVERFDGAARRWGPRRRPSDRAGLPPGPPEADAERLVAGVVDL